MPAEEIAFKVAHEGPLTEFTARNPGAVVSLWCDWRREVVEVSGASAKEVETLKLQLMQKSSVMDHFVVSESTHVLVYDCVDLPHDIVNKAVDDARCVNVPPTRFEGKWEHYQVVSFAEERSRELFQALRGSERNIEMISKKKLAVQPLLNTRSIAVQSILHTLTDKQLDALLLATRHGMYASPRATTAEAIADAVGVSRSTFEEHLRKAENRVVLALVPYLELASKARKASARPPT
jgi:predicted DNA binding protein